jgi:hypothetical protein
VQIEDAVRVLDAAREAGDSSEQALAAVERVAPDITPFVRRALVSQELRTVVMLLSFILALLGQVQQFSQRDPLSEEQMTRAVANALAEAAERLPGPQATAPEAEVWPEPGARDAPENP